MSDEEADEERTLLEEEFVRRESELLVLADIQRKSGFTSRSSLARTLPGKFSSAEAAPESMDVGLSHPQPERTKKD